MFDGTNDQSTIPNSSTYNNSNSKTVEMWMNVGNVGSSFVNIITNRTDDFNVNFTFLLDNRKLVRTWNPTGADNMVLIYSFGNGTNGYYAYSKDKFGTTNGDNIWHQIVGITDMSQNKIFLYYDGILVNTAVTSGTPVLPNNSVRIGSGYTNASFDFPLNGKVSTLRIYNRALSASEIQQNYNALKSRFNL